MVGNIFILNSLFLSIHKKSIQVIYPKREGEVRPWSMRAAYHKLWWDYSLDSIIQRVFLSLSLTEGVF